MKKVMKARELIRLNESIVGNQLINYRGCTDVKAAKFAVGLSMILKAIKDPLETIQELTKPTEAMQAYGQALSKLRDKNTGKTQAEQLAAIEELKKEHPQAFTDSDLLLAKSEETSEMEFEIDLYRIPVSYLPGWFDDKASSEEISKKNSDGQIPLHAIATLVEFGILYDPAEEGQSGK
jgi:hypothetical protein